MSNDLISREALKKALKSNCDLCHDKNTNWCEHCCPLNDFEDLIDNAPTAVDVKGAELAYNNGYKHAKEKYKRPQGKCETCDYHNFTQAIINGIVELMSKNGITTIEELLETLKGGAE